MPFNVELIDEFDKAPDCGAWNSQLREAAGNVVFLTREYQQIWWDAFCTDCTLHLLVFRDGANPQGYAPFYLSSVSAEQAIDERARAVDWQRIKRRHLAETNADATPVARTAGMQVESAATEPPSPAPREGERVVRLVGGVDVTDYLDIITPADQLEESWSAALSYWAAKSDEWDVIDLHSLPGWSPSAQIVTRLAAERGWEVWCDVEETCPVAALPDTWEGFLETLNKKDRHELRRKLRRADERADEITYRLLREPDELREGLEQFLVLHRKSDEAKAKFMSPAMEGFFRRLVERTAGTGWPEIAVLESEGRSVAAYLSFNYAGRLHLYNSGFDPDHGGYGAGFVLLVRRMQDAVESGIKQFDFLRGDERYKYDLGGRDNFIYRVIIRKGQVVHQTESDRRHLHVSRFTFQAAAPDWL